ncbi:MAG: hypothetical protein ABSE45_00480 [Candidatus Acidiferrales bacterium]|jgi:hypothetical protein
MHKPPHQDHGGLKVILVFVAMMGAVAFASWWLRMPSDSNLRQRFFRNESDFANLIEMSNQDSHVILIRSNSTSLDTDVSWPRQDIGFSEHRWNEYRRLFHSLKIESLTRRADLPSCIFITVFASGGVLGSSDKGYAYSEKPLAPVVPSLDVMPQDLYNRNKGHALVFEPLAPNWYMFREEY